MCDPKPGARCSYDTAKELAEAKAKLERASAELARDPEEGAAARRLEHARENLARKQAAYDSAPRGQRELASAIRASSDPASADVDELRTRLAVGRQTRVDQKRALARAEGGTLSVELVEADKALARLRHPEGVLLAAGLGRYDTVGFFTQPEAPFMPLAELRAIHLIEAVVPAPGGPSGFVAIWVQGGVASVGLSMKVGSAEEARAFSGGRFFDAQLGVPATPAPAGTALRYLAPSGSAADLEAVVSAIAAVRSLNGRDPESVEVAQLLQRANLEATASAVAAMLDRTAGR